MKKDKTLDYTNYECGQFHVYGLLLTNDSVYFNEGNKRPLKQSDFLHGPSLKNFVNSLYESMELPKPAFNEYFGVSVQGTNNCVAFALFYLLLAQQFNGYAPKQVTFTVADQEIFHKWLRKVF